MQYPFFFGFFSYSYFSGDWHMSENCPDISLNSPTEGLYKKTLYPAKYFGSNERSYLPRYTLVDVDPICRAAAGITVRPVCTSYTVIITSRDGKTLTGACTGCIRFYNFPASVV